MSENFGKDMTTGSIPRHLLSYSIPLLAGNLLQTGYHIVNTIWVGKIVGDNAVGATAVALPIIFILIAMASGATLATTILVSQYYGAKNYEMVGRVVNNSFAAAIVIGLFMTITGIAASDFLLRLMNTPDKIFSMASSYLKISLLGYVLLFLGFLILSILRGIGDTTTPLVFLVIGIGLNALLDPILIAGFGPIPRFGLNGAAYASLMSQGTAALLAIIYLNRKNHIIALKPKNFKLEKKILLMIFRLGLPSMVQQSLVSLGTAFITTFVNAFGPVATAAFGAGSRIDSVAFMPAMSLGSSASALTGQNLGAGRPERIKEIFKWGVIMTSIITVLISLTAIALPRLLLSMFVNDSKVLDIGTDYLLIQGGSYIFFAVMYIASGIANGAGHTAITMVFSLVSLWIVRVPVAAFLSNRTTLGLNGIWLAVALSYFATMVVSLIYYFSGRWKKSAVKHN